MPSNGAQVRYDERGGVGALTQRTADPRYGVCSLSETGLTREGAKVLGPGLGKLEMLKDLEYVGRPKGRTGSYA